MYMYLIFNLFNVSYSSNVLILSVVSLISMKRAIYSTTQCRIGGTERGLAVEAVEVVVEAMVVVVAMAVVEVMLKAAAVVVMIKKRNSASENVKIRSV